METFMRLGLIALAIGVSSAVLFYFVFKFKVTKFIYGAYLLFALSVASGLWSILSPNTGGWDDIIFMIYAMIFAISGVVYLIILWLFKLLKKRNAH